eukprot:scaffold1873_cov74-Phaeocystis_antarctica.AAC.4
MAAACSLAVAGERGTSSPPSSSHCFATAGNTLRSSFADVLAPTQKALGVNTSYGSAFFFVASTR